MLTFAWRYYEVFLPLCIVFRLLYYCLFACHIFIVTRRYTYRDVGTAEAIFTASENFSTAAHLSNTILNGGAVVIGQCDLVFVALCAYFT